MRLAFAFCLVVLAAPALAADWTTVPLGTYSDILDVINAETVNVWAVGRNGFVSESDANQATWTTIDVGTTRDLDSILEPSSGQVWIGGSHGVVRVKSGTSWLVRDIPDTSEDFHLYTRDSGCAMAVGTGGSIFSTCDYGQTWTRQMSGTTKALHAGAGFVEGPSWVVGDLGTILNTTNGGATWTSQTSGTYEDLYGIVEDQPFAEVVVGKGGIILKTTNGGTTWSWRNSGTVANLRAICPSPSNGYILVAVGDGGTVIRSSDYGDTWCPIFPGTTENLNAIDTFGDAYYFTGGRYGMFQETTDGGGGCVIPAQVGDGDLRPAEIEISGPEPCPVTTDAQFRLRAMRAAAVQIGVVDLLGRQVAALGRGTIPADRETALRVDTRGWSSGVYWLRVKGEGLETARRMIVVR